MRQVKVKISLGEFFDRISILEIKFEKENEKQGGAIFSELKDLKSAPEYKLVIDNIDLYKMFKKLKKVNQNICKHIERQSTLMDNDDIGVAFVESSASIAILKKERSFLKNDISNFE